MQVALLVLVFAISVVNAQKPEAHSDPDKRSPATESKDTANSAGRTVIVINQQGPDEQENNQARKPPNYFHELLLPQNVLTFALVLVGIGGIITAIFTLRRINAQVVEMRRQGELMFGQLRAIQEQVTEMSEQTSILENSVAAASKGAEAARLNAKAVLNAERPWIDIQVRINPGGHEYHFDAVNYGRTPAEIVSSATEFKIVRDEFLELEQPPTYKDRALRYHKFMFPNRSPESCGVCLVPAILDASGQDGTDARKGSKNFVIFGRVVYYDVLHKTEPPHETRYCYRFNPHDGSVFLSGPNSYNEHT